MDSESTSSGLLSPRDKATRQEILKREVANRHRGVQDRSGGTVPKFKYVLKCCDLDILRFMHVTCRSRVDTYAVPQRSTHATSLRGLV